MFKFHITGYKGIGCNREYYWSNRPVDITVIAENKNEAIRKAENELGHPISVHHLKVVAKEMEGA